MFSDEASNAAFLLSFWASMGTFLGGLLVVALVGILGADPAAKGTSKIMGVLQSFSGGVMIFMTCFHLIPESIELIGARESMIYFFFGVLLFGFLDQVIIPHDHDEHKQSQEPDKKKPKTKDSSEKQGEITQKDRFDLYRTGLITFIAMALHNIPVGLIDIGRHLCILGCTK
jgi:ZIP family zinc transporter